MNEINHKETAGRELVQSIPINMIEQSYDLNPRKKIEENHLKQITQNIRQHGLLTPLLLYKNNENKLQVIAGMVRLKAATSLGLMEVPARILEVDEEEARLLALKTNLEPEDHALTALEVSVAIQELCKKFLWTQTQVAEKLGMDKTRVSRLLALVDDDRTHHNVRDALEDGKISTEHAFEVIRLQREDQQTVIDEVISKGLSRNETRIAVEKSENYSGSQKVAPAQLDLEKFKLISNLMMDMAEEIVYTNITYNKERQFDLDPKIVSFIDKVGCFSPELAGELIAHGRYANFMSRYLWDDNDDNEEYRAAADRWKNLAKKYNTKFGL